MNISDIFKLRKPNRFGHWGIELCIPIRTADSKRVFTQGSLGTDRTRDVLLTPPSKAELAENAKRVAIMSGLDLGRTWVGDMLEKFDLITDRKQLGDAISSAVATLADYGTKRGRATGNEVDETGSMVVLGDEKRGGREEDVTGHEVTGSASKQTGDAMRKWRDQDRERIKAMNEANQKAWPSAKPAA
jgi:hypothetical protein